MGEWMDMMYQGRPDQICHECGKAYGLNFPPDCDNDQAKCPAKKFIADFDDLETSEIYRMRGRPSGAFAALSLVVSVALFAALAYMAIWAGFGWLGDFLEAVNWGPM
jgi:hypothetical protein